MNRDWTSKSYYSNDVSFPSRSSNEEGGDREQPHAGSHFGGQLPSVRIVDKVESREVDELVSREPGSDNSGTEEEFDTG